MHAAGAGGGRGEESQQHGGAAARDKRKQLPSQIRVCLQRVVPTPLDASAQVVDLVKEYNALGRGCVALMLDTKGPEVRSGDLAEPMELRTGAPLPLWSETTSATLNLTRCCALHQSLIVWHLAMVWAVLCHKTAVMFPVALTLPHPV